MVSKRSVPGWIGAAVGGLLAAALTSGCSDGDTEYVFVEPASHPEVTLRDRLGTPIAVESQEPYSPRATCGECHWTDYITNAYHFQQGRTNELGVLQVEDDFFADGREYIRSPGMYGKW